ncbi:MAG: hypothetical protein A2X77_02460 [Gammaproteobacteria bacterium GWE2_42_36]|nr:MAG: hypothetical protein A2X77_02460 [Gammaproteobacteria bacterium GWE2_42_36]
MLYSLLNTGRKKTNAFIQLHLTIVFILFSIGLANFLYVIPLLLQSKLQIPVSMHEWSYMFFFPEKPITILSYLIAIPVFFGYFYLYFICYQFLSTHTIQRTIARSSLSLLLSFAINLLIVLNKTHVVLAASVPLWIFAFYFTLYPLLAVRSSIRKACTTPHSIALQIHLLKKIYYLLGGIVLLQFIFIFQPMVFGKLKVINEFWDIPEQTWLTDHYVDNTQYINTHHLIGLHSKYDLRLKTDTVIDDNCIPLANTPSLQKLIQRKNSAWLAAIKQGVFDQATYYYRGGLCVIGDLTTDDKLNLLHWANTQNEKSGLIYLFHRMSQNQGEGLSQTNTQDNSFFIAQTPEEKFVALNKLETHWQILNRFFFHHQNFVLSPINEINLGKNPHQVYMQYGYINTIIIKDILHFFGPIRLDHYIKALFSFYYFYYALFLLLLILLFKDIRYVVPILLLCTAALNYINFDFLLIAPGINPIRHFFDLFIFCFLFLYLLREKKWYLILAIVSGLIATVANPQFGLFAYFALIITLSAKWLLSHQTKLLKLSSIGLFLVFAAIGIIVYKSTNIGATVLNNYYLAGLLGFHLKRTLFIGILLLLGICYIVISHALIKKNTFAYVALFSVLYSQGALLYYIWGSDLTHLLVLNSILIIAIFSILKLAFENYTPLKEKQHLYLISIGLLACMIYLPSVAYFYYTKAKFDRVFSTHKTYEWDLPTAKFISTISPTYFLDSINLIQSFSSSNSIYIISKYDNMLPFLAGKYSAMPYFDVPWLAIGDAETKDCIDTIKNNKPTYLFVDSDIDRSYARDIINAASIMGSSQDDLADSVNRVARLNSLKVIFDAVKDDYQPIQSAQLITVYKRTK